MNECENNAVDVNCAQICVNTFGSYKCACYDGYQETNDAIQCTGKSMSLCYYREQYIGNQF